MENRQPAYLYFCVRNSINVNYRQFCSFVGYKFVGRSFADEKISIPCLNTERTFLEKLFLLHEEFKRPTAEIRVRRMSRHFYDIQKISKTGYSEIATSDKQLYKSLVEHREHFMRWGGVDYSTHFPPNLNPLFPPNLLTAIEKRLQNDAGGNDLR